MPVAFGPFLCPLLFAALATVALPAQQAAVAQPKDLVFGTLHQGTTVQASFHVTWPTAATPAAVKIVPPTNVKVLRTATNAKVTSIWIEVGTAALGPCNGDIAVSFGDQRVAVPVQATVLPSMPHSSRVLVADSPWQEYSSEDSAVFAAWRHVVDTGKLEVSYLLPPKTGPVFSAEHLQRATVVLLGESSLFQLTKEDVSLLQGFVCGGGRLVVAADGFFVGTAAKATELLQPFGLSMPGTEAPGQALHEASAEDIAAHPLTGKVTKVVAHRPSPTQLLSPRAKALVKLPVLGDDALVAMATTAAGGEAISLGQSLWWLWIGRDEANEQLLRNLLTRPAR